MPLVLKCDGDCGEELTAETATTVGRLPGGERAYCAGCLAIWRACEADIDAERVRVVTAFAEFRAARLAKAREILKALPDE